MKDFYDFSLSRRIYGRGIFFFFNGMHFYGLVLPCPSRHALLFFLSNFRQLAHLVFGSTTSAKSHKTSHKYLHSMISIFARINKYLPHHAWTEFLFLLSITHPSQPSTSACSSFCITCQYSSANTIDLHEAVILDVTLLSEISTRYMVLRPHIGNGCQSSTCPHALSCIGISCFP